MGKKLLQNLDVLLRMTRYRLPEGRRENSPWLGCVGSVMIFLAFDR